MNERIRELAQTAGLGFHGESITMLQDELPETVLGRFAELIIKECARLCNNFDVHYADNSPLKREIALETAHDLADMILEHFEENI